VRDRTESLVREWPVDFSGWPEGRVLTVKQFDARLDENGGVLSLSPEVSLTGDVGLLRYLIHHLETYFNEASELSKAAFTRQRVARTEVVPDVLADFEQALSDRQAAEGRYLRAVELIDDIVERGLGLSPKLRERLARRMNEFPLNENANRPRLPWEETKKPRGRRFTAGERYH
jgi:hypothetical protein